MSLLVGVENAEKISRTWSSTIMVKHGVEAHGIDDHGECGDERFVLEW